MAFSFATFGKAGSSANSKSTDFFTYKSNDTFEEMKATGYFNPAKGQLRLGDIVYFYSISDATSYMTCVTAVEPDITLA